MSNIISLYHFQNSKIDPCKDTRELSISKNYIDHGWCAYKKTYSLTMLKSEN